MTGFQGAHLLFPRAAGGRSGGRSTGPDETRTFNMNELHPTHVKAPTPKSPGRLPEWYATYCTNCDQKILEESGDVTDEGAAACTAASA